MVSNTFLFGHVDNIRKRYLNHLSQWQPWGISNMSMAWYMFDSAFGIVLIQFVNCLAQLRAVVK